MEENKAVEQSQQPTEIDKALQSNVNSLRAVTTCHNLLSEACLPVRAHEAVKSSQAFLKSLYDQLLDECLAHPDAEKHPELKQFIVQRKKNKQFLKEIEAKSKALAEQPKEEGK